MHTYSRYVLTVLPLFLVRSAGDRIQKLLRVDLGFSLWAAALATVVLNLIIPTEETLYTPADCEVFLL